MTCPICGGSKYIVEPAKFSNLDVLHKQVHGKVFTIKLFSFPCKCTHGENKNMSHNLHESGRSPNALGNDLMFIERDLEQFFKGTKYIYTLTRHPSGHYQMVIGNNIVTLTSKLSLNPDEVVNDIISQLQLAKKEGEPDGRNSSEGA